MIRTVGTKQFQAILNNWRKNPSMIPKKQWLTFDKGKFLVIDNSLGHCDIKEFFTVDEAINFSKGVTSNGSTIDHF